MGHHPSVSGETTRDNMLLSPEADSVGKFLNSLCSRLLACSLFHMIPQAEHPTHWLLPTPVIGDVNTEAALWVGFRAILQGYRHNSRNANSFCSHSVRPQAINTICLKDNPSCQWCNNGKAATESPTRAQQGPVAGDQLCARGIITLGPQDSKSKKYMIVSGVKLMQAA